MVHSHEHHRHFIAQCIGIRTAQGSVFADLLERFNASLAEWRWGSLLGALQELLAIETPICQHWNAELMREAKKKTRQEKGAAQQEARAYNQPDQPRDQPSQTIPYQTKSKTKLDQTRQQHSI